MSILGKLKTYKWEKKKNHGALFQVRKIKSFYFSSKDEWILGSYVFCGILPSPELLNHQSSRHIVMLWITLITIFDFS